MYFYFTKNYMANIFIISDTHFGHKGMCHFLNYDGTKCRPFDNVKDMDDYMITKWNEVVKPNDKVYHLGDVYMGSIINFDTIMSKLNGDKVLIKGNHDSNCPAKRILNHFRDIRSCHVLNKHVLTHIPIHPDSLSRWVANIHGHLHNNTVKLSNGEEDHRYYNACVEKLNYTPKPIEDIFREIRCRKN